MTSSVDRSKMWFLLKLIRLHDMFLIFTDVAEYLEDIYTIIKQPTGKPKTIQTVHLPKC